MYLVFDPQSDLDATAEKDGKTLSQRWEFEDARTGAYIFKYELGKFIFIPGEEDRCQGPLLKLVDGITKIAR